jgi:hypothetical protein
MSLGSNLTTEIKSWGLMAILIVIVSLVLLKFKTSNVGNMTCPGLNQSHLFYNTSLNQCCLGTATAATDCTATGNLTSIGSVAQTTDTFITGLSEPKAWVAIALIALIGFGLMYYFTNKKRG